MRTADNEWLLETDSGGYRHPWVEDGDQCHADQRNPFRGRFIFGDTVNDGIVEFRLQSPDLEAQCDDSSCKPYLIDSSFSFTVSKGNAEKGGGVTLGAASAMTGLVAVSTFWTLLLKL